MTQRTAAFRSGQNRQQIPLGRIMLRIASRCARELQARFHTTGTFVRTALSRSTGRCRYYLLELLRYIHLNPIRARMVASPIEYPWSSHHAYQGHRTYGPAPLGPARTRLTGQPPLFSPLSYRISINATTRLRSEDLARGFYVRRQCGQAHCSS